MKRAIYFFGFIVLTVGDCIIGYKSAEAFGITEMWLMIIWASAFSLLSLPLKMIYDYLNSLKVNFFNFFDSSFTFPVGRYLFSAIWLYTAYAALSGVSEVRKLYRQQQANTGFTQNYEYQPDTSAVRNRYQMRVQLERLKQQGKLDSLVTVNNLKIREQQYSMHSALITDYQSDFYLFINLIFILSAAVCLSVALETEAKNDTLSEPQIISDASQSINVLLHPEESTEEPAEELQQVVIADKVECTCCKRRFKSFQAFRGHIRKGNNCQKTDFLEL